MEVSTDKLEAMLREAFKAGRYDSQGGPPNTIAQTYAAEQIRRLEAAPAICEPCSQSDHQRCTDYPCACYIAGQVGPFRQEKKS